MGVFYAVRVTTTDPTASQTDVPTTPVERLQCMDIWGGNHGISSQVVVPGLDAWVFSRPHAPDAGAPADAGGDIHFVTSCATGRITRLLVADVSGHGAPVAEAATSLRKLLGRYSNYIDQTVFVEAVNARFGDLAEQSATGGVMFATAVVATYFAPTDELSICNAGHPRPMWFSAREDSWSIIETPVSSDGPSNLPLGVLEPTLYPSFTLTLASQDLVLFYTDSLIEARSTDGRQLGEAGLRTLLSGLRAESPDTFIRLLLASIERWARTGPKSDGSTHDPFNDDVTVLLIRPNQNKPRPGTMLGTQGTWNLLKAGVRSLTRGEMPVMPDLGLRELGGAFFARLNRRGRGTTPTKP